MCFLGTAKMSNLIQQFRSMEIDFMGVQIGSLPVSYIDEYCCYL
jgi:hypothetical protein